jgi:hypothetical protein
MFRRKVNKEIALKYKEDNKIDLFIETSAKTGFNAKNVNKVIITKGVYRSCENVILRTSTIHR